MQDTKSEEKCSSPILQEEMTKALHQDPHIPNLPTCLNTLPA